MNKQNHFEPKPTLRASVFAARPPSTLSLQLLLQPVTVTLDKGEATAASPVTI
jgi:hypothetical protein